MSISTTSTTCVIGDIHGCHTALVQLLDIILPKANTLVFLGDYVDRGPHSKEVVTTILSLRTRRSRVVTLMGNHDFLFLQYLSGGDDRLFLQAGGIETLASYDIDPLASLEERRNQVPSDHLAFFKTLPLYWEDQHALYVHAGLQPGRHLSQQTQHWCLWARDTFLTTPLDFKKPVVFGHTVFPEPYLCVDKIGIDTGAVYGGKLTALLLPDRELISIPGPKSHSSFLYGS